jgi:hypothetical protein
MQNRYVGDVGDFAKFALLRRLAGITGERQIRLGVIWCLYPDESHNRNGRHVSYLSRAEFEQLDLELTAALRRIVDSSRRSIAAVAAAEILPPETIFCNALIRSPDGGMSSRESRLVDRSKWLEDCFRRTEPSELVFFDPDNGVEVRSVPKHNIKAGKYIYWNELVGFWDRGQALLIYHHLNRTKPAAEQVTELGIHLRAKFDGALIKPLVFRRGSCRVFWLVCPLTSLGREIERRANAFLSNGWTAHFRPFN